MKILHNIKLQEDGLTLKGQILETIFEEGEEREDGVEIYTKDGKFNLSSLEHPSLYEDSLCAWGSQEDCDEDILEYTYKSKEGALKILDYINEFSIEGKVFIFDIELEDFSNIKNHQKILEVFDFQDKNKDYELRFSYEFLKHKCNFIKNKKGLELNLLRTKVRFTAKFIKNLTK